MSNNFLKVVLCSVFFCGYAQAQSSSAAQTLKNDLNSLSTKISNSKGQEHNLAFGVETRAQWLLGFQGEATIQDDSLIQLNIGKGGDFWGFGAAWKQNFETYGWSTYTTAGLSHWFGNGSKSANNNYLKNVLTDEEKKSDSFAVEMLTGSAGIEVFPFAADYETTAIFTEIQALVPLRKFDVMPSVAVGMKYFF